MSDPLAPATLQVALRRYAQLMVYLIALPVVFMALIGALFFQPYWGPLTRLGGYLENEYGWNQPQAIFDAPLFKIARDLSEYDRYYDVVVVGDSFSYDERKGWQNFFVEQTGLSVITLSQEKGLARIVTSDTFRLSPPRYLIYESLEQFSLMRLQQFKTLPALELSAHDESSANAAGKIAASLSQLNLVERSATPPLGRSKIPSVETRIVQFHDYLMKSLERQLQGEPSSGELRALWGTGLENMSFPLSLRDDAASLFSSKLNHSLLVYSLDLAKVTDMAWAKQAAQGAWQLQRSIEANGRTKLVVMLFPDKLTIYAPYLAEPSLAPPSTIPLLAQDYPLEVRLDKVFSEAVASGVQDLYLPDDTHCGYKGYKLAAEHLIEAIELRERAGARSSL